MSSTQIKPRMPAEWEPHASTWLAWPHYRGDWPGKFEPIPWVYAEIIRHLSRHERVDLIVPSATSEKHASQVLTKSNTLSSQVRFHRWPTDRVWTRDSGCTFVLRGAGGALARELRGEQVGRNSSPRSARSGTSLAGITWRFNAWAKYPNYSHDAKIGTRMAKAAHAGSIRPMHVRSRVVLEGGSIEVNGRGTLLTTEECLLSTTQQRNPDMARTDYEELFAEHLGISNVIWLGSGVAGDDTHGHVDDLARFVSPGTIVTAVEPNREDINYQPLQENLRRLRAATDQNGKPLSIVELPMPRAVVFAGHRLPASYANFYVANGIVLVPVFNDPNDRVALDILASLFPDREVVGIYSGDLIWGFGAMHCMTQQQPEI